MKNVSHLVAVLGLLAVTLGLPTAASANIALTFDQSLYSIASVGGTAAVGVYIQQVGPITSGEPIINSLNGLVASSIKITISDSSIANVLSSSSITAGAAWDASSSGFSGTSPDLAVVSLAGVAINTSRVLMGTFTFTGLKAGSTLVISAVEDPKTSNLLDANNDVLDPFVTGSNATITVGGAVISTPEPATLGGALVAALCGIGHRLSRRRVKDADEREKPSVTAV